MRTLPTRKQIKDRKKAESPIELILLREFHLMGLYPTPQFKVGKYRIDLAFPKELIAIECDGKEWHSTNEQIIRDVAREIYLENQGWKVLRFTGSDIFRFAGKIAKEVFTHERTGTKRSSLIAAVSIDYEEELPEFIEEKENLIKQMVNESNAFIPHELESIKQVMEKRYKYSV